MRNKYEYETNALDRAIEVMPPEQFERCLLAMPDADEVGDEEFNHFWVSALASNERFASVVAES